MTVITLQLRIEEKEFRKMKNLKEQEKILKNATSWEDYLLKLTGVRK